MMASSDRTNSSISARLVPVFNALSEAASVAEYYGPYCPHLFIVITGASVGGIGFEVAQTLSKYGAQIFLCCHTQQACETATHKIKEFNPSAIVRGFPLDLSSFRSIQQCADLINSLNKPIHILIHNASVLETSIKMTEDGFETVWQVNYLGPFYFTQLLLPLLKAAGTPAVPSRVVLTSSILNCAYNAYDEGINFTNTHRGSFYHNDPFQNYAQSKLAGILFARQLTKYFKETNNRYDIDTVIGVSLHPGVCLNTKLYRSMSFYSTIGFCYNVFWNGKGKLLRSETQKTISQAAATTVYCALHSDIEGGQHYADCAKNDIVHEQANNEEAWIKLWDLSQRQVDQRLNELAIVGHR